MIEIPLGEGWLSIGNIALFDFDWRIRMAELGVLIGDKEYWNKGYGTEAVGLLIKHAFATLNLNRVFLRVYQTNPRAIRAYEKAGFVHEGRFRQAHYHDGEYVDVIFMSVLRSEWQATT
jgi:RimJ/RimL family protein N-acetyltransferase